LKTFLTYFGPTVPLMLDPPVRVERGGREGRPIKFRC